MIPKSQKVRTVLNKKKQTDSWFLDAYTLNPYSGCSFNCLYCYIRGSKYGENMADSVSVKENFLPILEKQLISRAKKKDVGYVVLGSATDPYLHFEVEQKLSRGALELLNKYKFPVHVITKSPMISRDFDLLEKIDSHSLLPIAFKEKPGRGAIISFSFSTLDDVIGKIFEPGAPLPSLRLAALKNTADAGFLTGVSLMPLLPWISDTREHLEQYFKVFKEAGASYLFPAGLTLFGTERGDSKPMVMRAVSKHFPHLEEKYMRLFGKSDYLPGFYQKAFMLRMHELSQKYELPLRLV